MYYDRLNVIKDPNKIVLGSNIRRLDLGTAVHELFQKYFEDMGILVEAERYVKDPTFQVAGKIDAILKVHGEENITELKTIDSPSKVPYLPNIGHIYQVQYYMHLTGIHKGTLLYISMAKDKEIIQSDKTSLTDYDLIEFPIEYNPDLIVMIQSKLKAIMTNINLEKSPPATYGNVPDCKWCDYAYVCTQDFQTLVDLDSVFDLEV